MLKRGTKVTLYSPELGGSRSLEVAHATALLVSMEGVKNPTWELPKGSKYTFQDGEIRPNKVRRDSKKDS